MNSLLQLNRRALVRLGLASAAFPPLAGALNQTLFAQDAGPDSGSVGAVGGNTVRAR